MDRNWPVTIRVDPAMPEGEVTVVCRDVELAHRVKQYLVASQNADASVWVIKNGQQQYFVEKSRVVMLDVHSDMLTIHTTSDTYCVRMTLKEALAQLDLPSLLQVSKFSALNVRYLQRLELAFSGNLYAHLRNGQVVTVSRRFVAQLKQYLRIRK